MDNITWSPSAACSNCGISFLANTFLVCELTPEQLINGPYPGINMSGNRMSCPQCGNLAEVLDYTPEIIKSELQAMREKFLDVREGDLKLVLEAIQNSNPQNYDELYQLVLKISPSISEVIQGFKSTLNWICLIGGTWAFFKELERTLG